MPVLDGSYFNTSIMYYAVGNPHDTYNGTSRKDYCDVRGHFEVGLVRPDSGHLLKELVCDERSERGLEQALPTGDFPDRPKK